MVNVDFGACLSNYWFVWTINGLGSLFTLAINMAISYFFLKYFHSLASSATSTSSSSAPASGGQSSSFAGIGSSSPS